MPQDPSSGQTPLDALEQQLREAQKMEAVGLLAAGVAHDFNNLLTVINGYSDVLLNKHHLPADARELIDGIREAGARAAGLARALLTFSRRKPQESRLVDLDACVRELQALASRVLPANIEVTAVAGDGSKTVWADPSFLQHALLNLVFNARDAMPQGGRLELRTASLAIDPDGAPPVPPPGNYVLLTVRDTGSGMDEETRRRIFEPFYTSKPDGAGTGLGLPMVQYIVKQSGGFLAVESEKGHGTTVKIYLPRHAENEARPSDGPSAEPPRGHETVLVVEESAEMRRFLHTMLENLGYAVLEAASAREAEAWSGNFAEVIDLLVTNLVLADSTGMALAHRLRTARAGLRALYISGASEKAAAAAGGPESGEDFLMKPFNLAGLAATARRLLDRPQPRKILFVDDDAGVALFAMRVLREAGFEVLVAGNRKVALHTLETEHPDLVITDLVLPDRGGLETIALMRQSRPSLPLIASSALGRHFLKMAEGMGARATLAKPFTAEELLEAVRQALEPR